jgi:3-phosphoshikimate 1-carboxyvinyltransferase
MMQGKSEQLIRPARNIAGTLRLRGDKSISHRYAMLGALAEGTTTLKNFSTGADCASTLACIGALGARVSKGENGIVEIQGTGGALRQPASALDCGNSGSTMRMLSGIVAAQEAECELFGDESLSRRPMKRVVEPLVRMGAKVDTAENSRPPLRIRGGKLKGIEYFTPVASAQVKSLVMFAGLQADGETTVEEPVATRDHSELALRAFGAEVQRSKNRVTIRGGQKLKAIEAFVPGDISSAAFFLCAAALFPESNLVIEAVGLNPTRAALLDVLAAMGVRTSVVTLEEHHGELIGTLKVEASKLVGTMIAGTQPSLMIDELPVLAAIAPYTKDGMEIRGAKELRVKESDRIAAVTQNLRAMGAQVTEFDDGWSIPGGQRLHGAEVDSHDDHRIAMAFAVAALRAEGETLIKGADAASISFAEFWETLDRIAER